MEPRVAGALMTGLDILEALSTVTAPVGVTHLARTIDGDKGNVHRLLGTLESRGYVTQNPTTKAYSLAPGVVQLAGTMLRNMDVVTLARPLMAELVDTTGESVHLAHRSSNGAVYLARDRKTNGVVVETEIGAQAVVHATATGKALFCRDSRDRLQNLVGIELEPFTPHTIVDFDQLVDELRLTATRGYAIDDEELNLGVRCVAAPVSDLQGRHIATIGLSGPAGRIDRTRLDSLADIVVEAANKLSAHLGGVPASPAQGQD